MADDLGTFKTRRDAEKHVRWMAKGGFRSGIRKEADGYHVYSLGYNAKGERDHEMLRGTRA